MSNLIAQRQGYFESVVVDADGKEAGFRDPFNKFLDDVLIEVDSLSAAAAVTPCGVSARLTSDVTLTADTEAQLTAWTEDWDLGGNFASGVFTAPEDGGYIFGGQILFQVAADGNQMRVRLKLNGSLIAESRLSASGTGLQSVPIPPRGLLLDAGDEVTVHVINVNGNDTVDAASGDVVFTSLTIQRTHIA